MHKMQFNHLIALAWCSTCILFLNYNSASNRIVKTVLPISDIPLYHYTMSGDGNLFYYFKDNVIYGLDAETGILKDSVLCDAGDSVTLNLINTQTGVSIIFFEKKSQYDATVCKRIFQYNFNRELKILDTLIFLTIPESRLLDEDFKFVTAYIDKTNNTEYLQDAFCHVYSITENRWSFDPKPHSAVDIGNGVLYELKNEDDELGPKKHLSSTFGKTLLRERNSIIGQFSVVNSKIIYSDSRKCYYSQRNAEDWRYMDAEGFNPVHRFENGMYYVSEGLLVRVFLTGF